MNKINYTSNYLTKHSRDFYRGQSIHYSGKWTIGSHYIYDNYEIDFVVHNNVLLACSKSHLANIDNKPTDFIYDDRGTIIGINSDCWDFVLAGILGKEGKIYLPSYDKDTGVLTWHLISKDEAEEESTGGEILMSLAGLKDDENHRVVTDIQISSWDKVVEDLSNFIEDSPFRKGTGTDSAVLKVNIAENIALGLGSVAEGVQTKAIGNGSHTEGLGTIANNGAEHAFGVYNKSNKASDTFYDAGNTLFSIGMGWSEDHRENAVEVMQNSDVYVRGIGDYDGTNPADASTLKKVIDSKADSTDLNDYVKKINNPFAVGSGTQSAFQKNPDHPNTASGNSSVAIGADNEATKIGSFAANRKNHATGDDSNATGYGTTASGDASHAEGHYTTASGKYSHTEGHGTTASNDGTHAEGWNSKATGDTSHAEGHGTVAGGPRSHTEGKYTKTSNDSEHAQGMYNKTNTGTIHSIGIGTSDSDRKNVVEVLNNGKVYITGIGDYDGTNPSNNNSLQSLVSAFITKSVNDLTNYYLKSDTYSKQEVANLIGAINQFHYEIYSNLNSINSPQTNILYLIGPSGDGTDKYEEYVYAVNNFVKIGDTSIDLSNYITIDALNTALSSYLRISDAPFEKGTGENSIQQKGTDANASGEASVAFNMGSASGEYSFAEGYDTTASGDNSHAEGGSTEALGDFSHTEGSNTLSGQKGYKYTNTGNVTNQLTLTSVDGLSVGDVVSIVNDSKYPDCATITEINGNTIIFDSLPFDSIVPDLTGFDDYLVYVSAKPNIGNVDIAIASHAEGVGTKAQNYTAHAEGRDTQALGSYSHAEGRETIAQYASHAEGRNTQAFGEYSHSEGFNTIASGNKSHAEGNGTISDSYASHTEGYGTVVSNNDISATVNNNASGAAYSHAEGNGVSVTSHSSHGEGRGVKVTGNSAHGEGLKTTAAGNASHAEGNSSVANGSSSHAEGHSTVTQNLAEHAEGRYNRSNTGTRHSVGIGTSDAARKNAFEIMENGDAYLFGVGGYNGINPKSTNTLQQVLDSFITKTVSDLTNYYAKSQTYSRTEVKNLIDAVKQFEYEAVNVLPSASASTMYKIYLVPSKDTQTQNVKDEYITVEENGVYAWEQIGSTAVNLNGYVKDEELNEALANYVTSSAFLDALAGKQDTISDLDEIRSGAAFGRSAVQTETEQTLTEEQKAQARTNIGAGTYSKPSGGIPKSDLSDDVQTSLGKADSALQEHQSLAAYVNGGSYNSTTKKIELKHGTTVLAEIDATAFIKDGMVSDVQITGGNLVISFNTDSGKEAITIPLTDIFDPANYYTKSATNELLATKYTKPATGIPATDLSEAVQESLAKADNPPTEVFWATYGETTAAEIDAAIAEGKVVMCIYNKAIYFYTQENNTTIYFGSIHNDYVRRLELKRSDNTWSGTSIQLEWTGHKVTSWNATPNNTAYPSEKLVKDSIDSKYTKPSTGIPATDIAEGVIPDVAQFITRSVNDLVNYYLKSEVYTKDEVAALIGAIQQFHYEIAASTSAVTTPSNNVLYLIGPSGEGADRYEEYVYSSGWVKIGDSSIDLSGYVTTQTLNAALASYATNASLATVAKSGSYRDLTDTPTISKPLFVIPVSYQEGAVYSLNTPIPVTVDPSITYQDIADAYNDERVFAIYIDGGYIMASLASLFDDGNIEIMGASTQVGNERIISQQFHLSATSLELNGDVETSMVSIPTQVAISTNIKNDKTSDVMAASPKAVYDEIHPAVPSAQPTGGMLPNILYNLGELAGDTTFTLATPSDANIVNHYFWTFDTGSTAPTITWPSGLSWFGGSAPTINASKHYEISVLNGIAVAMEV